MRHVRRTSMAMGAVAVALALAGCFGLSNAAAVRRLTKHPLGAWHAQLITGNDTAFREKLQLVEGARSSVDAMYYIYSDDYSSSVLSEALIAAAQRGVRVRLLLDYHTNYRHLDLLSLMEREGSKGKGSLEVRFYNRPTRNIVMDAVYLTLGCGTSDRPACSPLRLADIERRFVEERVDSRPAADLGVSNLNIANSGLFLSGLYGKRPDVMAFAVLRAQDLDVARLAEGQASAPDGSQEVVRQISTLFLDGSRIAPTQVLAAKIELGFALGLSRGMAESMLAPLRPLLPPERQGFQGSAQDWDHVTDFLHHKLLLVDAERLQLGGRNIEDSYHMRPNPLVDKYVFVDTDLRVALRDGGERVQAAFERLWNFRTMVASLPEVRRHAPNDFVEALSTGGEACQGLRDARERGLCLRREVARAAVPLAEREDRLYAAMHQNARRYWLAYPYASTPDPTPPRWVDAGAALAYVENLPFAGNPARARRSYGSKNGQEARYGKVIHALWLKDIEDVCRTATEASPGRMILHNAYFFPPTNLVSALARMVDGRLDCSHVTVTVITNSEETTDLFVVNVLARQSLLAFAEHYRSRRDPARSARFEFYEYRKFEGRDRVSLHTKVSVLGNDVIVGSANADVRTYMMDSNNAMLIRGAPEFRAGYVAELDRTIHAADLTRDVTERVLGATREDVLAENRASFEKLVAGYGLTNSLDPTQLAAAQQTFLELLGLAYSLTKGTLDGGRDAKKEAEQFNELFKPI